MLTAPAVTATRQFAGVVLVPVLPDKLDALRALLDQLGQQTLLAMRGQAVPDGVIPFERLETVHYARFVLVDHHPGVEPLLVLSTSFDGPEGEDACSPARALDFHIEDLVRHATPGLEQVFACCRGYRNGQLAAFLRANQHPTSTFYVGSSGRSRRQILWEADLRRKVGRILDAGAFKDAAPETVRAEVLRQVQVEQASIPPFPAQPDLTRRVKIVEAILIALVAGLFVAVGIATGLTGLVALVAALGLLVWRFRHLERTDPQFQPEHSAEVVAQFRVASAHENHFLQNQLTHLVRIKAGPLRWILIRVVFAGLDFLAKNQFNQGKLGGIPSIHFAGWMLIPKRGVLFFSNFDSSWQSYLGDFIDQASNGLTAVWSNTEFYPRTKWLVNAGSRDAARFLDWTRHHQLPTQVWYCAYPGLSIVDINANTEIRRGLAEPSAMDAATWLFRLRGVDRLAADQLYSEDRAREPPLPMKDIQGIILWGYGHLPEARYLMFRVKRPGPALLKWLSQLPLASAAAESKTDEPPEPLINIAFTHRGLLALGLDAALCARFSTPFVQGSDDEYRARVNGDVGQDDPDHWNWGGPRRPVDLVLMVFAATTTSVSKFADRTIAAAQDLGLELVEKLEGTTLADRKEHFGFRDGMGQPIIAGSGRAETKGNTVAAGEFLLGHRDGYGNVTHSPVSSQGFAFGMNGSYLVFRQLEQNVEEFWRYCDAQAGGDAITVASKLVGRWPSGAPLVRHPEKDPQSVTYQDENDFTYLASDDDNDRYGARCPFGAHIRRSNPRDWQLAATRDDSLELSNLHRILRRGRPYGPPLDGLMSASAMVQKARVALGVTPKRGLQFLAFNTHIDRQFEFVQQQWLNNPKFAGQTSDPDPVLGPRRPASEWGTDTTGFTVQTDVKTGLCPRTSELRNFVRVVGSAYFFMPSIPAVKMLGGELLGASPADGLETLPPDEQLHIDSLADALREKLKRDYVGGQTLRDAHPKLHGCVRATFQVADNLDDGLKVGIFRDAKTFQAYVRFSNADGAVGPDAKKDIRGAAIKLLGVPGAKLLDGAEDSSTHDFLLISHPNFFVRDVAEFDAFVTAMAAGQASVLWYLLRHPRAALKLFESLKAHASPLAIQYFSATPYLWGGKAVKYSLRPTHPETAAIPSQPSLPRSRSRDYLREALKNRLAQGAFSFDFMVQQQRDPRAMPVEDPSVAWSEQDAPFRKVATLVIEPQDFDTLERRTFAEDLSFNPWRCLPEHRPLGGINRARRQVYRALSSFRHDRNSAPNPEPSGW